MSLNFLVIINIDTATMKVNKFTYFSHFNETFSQELTLCKIP